MFKKISQKFKGDRKYFSIVFFVLIIIGVSGIVTESLINKTKQNWDNILTEEISRIEESIKNDFNNKQNDLHNKLNVVRQDLKISLKPENESYKELVKLINNKLFDNYSIEIFAPNGKLIAWNHIIAINQDELFPLSFPLGETYFLSNDLLTYLSVIDTVHIQSDIFYLAISTPIEEKLRLNNKYLATKSFENEIAQKNQIDLSIDYSPYTEKSRDGRKFSFELLNSKNHKIGMVSFLKPLLSYAVNQIKDTASKIQSLLVVFAIFFAGFGLNNDFRKLDSYLFRFILLFIYLAALRALIFIVGFPTNFVNGALSDPSFFSSPFGWGIVKSPIEFFTTIVFIVLIAIQIFRYTRKYLYSARQNKFGIGGIFVAAILSVFIFLILRGVSASIKSVVFDSTIRYFKEPNILPDLPSLAMNLNMLLLSFAIVLTIVGIINLILKFLNLRLENLNKSKLSLVLFTVAIIIFLSYYISNDPLITPLIVVVFILLLYVLYYQVIVKDPFSAYNYLFILLISSVISIILLNYFNTKLEREALKTTAVEINRTDSNLLSYMIDETLNDLKSSDELPGLFGSRYTNYDALAFTIWGKSTMQRESLNSGIRFYDRFQKVLGEYFVGLNPDKKIFEHITKSDNIEVFEINNNEEDSIKYYAGIIKIEERGIIKGYAAAFVSFDIGSIGAINYPDFVESDRSILNRVIDVKQLKIFQFRGEKLNQVYGDIYPSRDQIKQIMQTRVDSVFNEAWLKIKFDNETYETFLMKNNNGSEDIITTVSVAERAFSWRLFNSL